MKTVVENSEVARLWAARAQSYARGSNFFFQDATIYSYGTHFAIARHSTYRGKPIVLFTTRTYSVTTSTHCGIVLWALRDHPRASIFEVKHPEDYQRIDPVAVMAEYRAKVDAEIAVALRAIKHCVWKMEYVPTIIEEANAKAEFMGIDDRLSFPGSFEDYIARAAQRADECEQRRIARFAAKKLTLSLEQSIPKGT